MARTRAAYSRQVSVTPSLGVRRARESGTRADVATNASHSVRKLETRGASDVIDPPVGSMAEQAAYYWLSANKASGLAGGALSDVTGR